MSTNDILSPYVHIPKEALRKDTKADLITLIGSLEARIDRLASERDHLADSNADLRRALRTAREDILRLHVKRDLDMVEMEAMRKEAEQAWTDVAIRLATESGELERI